MKKGRTRGGRFETSSAVGNPEFPPTWLEDGAINPDFVEWRRKMFQDMVDAALSGYVEMRGGLAAIKDIPEEDVREVLDNDRLISNVCIKDADGRVACAPTVDVKHIMITAMKEKRRCKATRKPDGDDYARKILDKQPRPDRFDYERGQ